MVYLGSPASSPFLPAEAKEKEKKSKQIRRISICTDNTKFTAIDTIAYYMGWSIVGEDELWNIYWSDSANDIKICHQMRRFQRINHFPSMHELSRKDLLSRNLLRMQRHFPTEYDFFPKTWLFPSDIPGAMQHAKEHKNTVFILKPGSGSCGNGIFLTKSLANVSPYQRMICQTYIKKPLLVDGFKFDLRVYTLITSMDPLRMYVYNEGLVRCATQRYHEPTEMNLSQKYMHLTNYSINKNSATYSRDQETGSKRTFSALKMMLEADGHNVAQLWSNIDDLIVKTIISALPVLSHSYRASFPLHDDISACFELLGFDIIIDHKLNPYLVEVNHSPSFTMDEPIDRKVKFSMLRDTLKLLYTNVNDKRRIIREDRNRILLRSLGSKDTLKRSELNRWQQNVQWEEEHLGNYRMVMPCDRRSNQYADMFATNVQASSAYSDTLISKKRASEAKQKRKALNDHEKKDVDTAQMPIQPRKITKLKLKRQNSLFRKIVLERTDQFANGGFGKDRIVSSDENVRRALWNERQKFVESFELQPLIYNQFFQNDLLSETDRKKFKKYIA